MGQFLGLVALLMIISTLTIKTVARVKVKTNMMILWSKILIAGGIYVDRRLPFAYCLVSVKSGHDSAFTKIILDC